jgi:chemotaxis protein MotB
MRGKNVLIILLAAALAATAGYTLYLYLGPYETLLQENRRLATEAETRQASKSHIEEEIARLRSTLDEQRRRLDTAKDELAARENLVKDLITSKEVLRTTVSRVQGQKEILEQETSRLRKTLEHSEGRLRQLSEDMETLKGHCQQEIQGLKDEVFRRGGQVQIFQDQVNQISREMAALEGQRTALSEQISGLENALKQSQERVQKLSQALTQREKGLKQVNQQYQTLVGKLKEQIQQKEVRISTLEERLSIHFLDRILFEPGNATITPHGRHVLRNVAEGLKTLSETEIRVEGHTDNQPLSEAARAVHIDNLGLSVERAAAVARTLRVMGVDPSSISASGYSMYRPVGSNDTPEGRQLNRRVEIVVAPIR